MGGLSLGTLSITIEAAVDQALGELQKFGSEVGSIIDDQKSKWEGFSNVGQSLSGVGQSLTLAITAPLAALGAVAVKSAADLETMKKGLAAVEGSAAAADARLTSLKEVAKLPGLGLAEAVEGYTRLKAVGVNAKEAEGYLMSFGNALATVGKGRADLDAVITQLTQMLTKEKVVAGDLKPIMERIPQVAAIVKQAYGTIDTEALQKMGVKTQDFVTLVTTELNKLPSVAGGLNNAFENLKDTVTASLSKIGAVLAPTVEAITPVIERLVTVLGSLAEWFAGLPAPVQAFALTFVALAAAIGPVLLIAGQLAIAIGALMPVLTAMAGAIGVSVVALGGWVIAIAAVVAGLVALGVWVYQNWNKIMAVIQDALAYVVGKITDFVNWLGKLVPATSAAGKALADTASALKKYGDEAKLSADLNRQLQVETDKKAEADKKAKAATTSLSTAVKTNADEQKKQAEATKAAAKAAADCEKDYKALAPRYTTVTALGQELAAAHNKLAKEIAAAQIKAESFTGLITSDLAPAVNNAILGSEKWQAKLSEIGKDGLPKVLEHIAQIKPKLDPATGSVEAMTAALGSLGITSAAKFSQLATDAQKAYDAVIAAPQATQWEKDSAFLKLLEAQRQKMLANGVEIPALMDQQMADIKAKIDGKAPEVKSSFGGMLDSVSTVITNFAQKASELLWDSDKSWGEKGKALLKSLGEAFTSQFTEVATKAVTDFITGALKSLLSGDGLGGVLSTLKDIGSTATDAFSKVSGGTPSVPGGGTPSVPGGGGGAGGAGAAVGAGLTGWISAISGAVTAISSVIGNFQMAGMNKSLDIIVKHTLQTANDLANLRRDDWDRHAEYAKWKDDILPALWGIQGNTGTAIASLQAIETHCYNASASLADMLTDSRTSGPAAASFMENVVNLLGKMVYKLESLAAGSGLSMNLYGTDPTTVAGRIATQMRLQGGRA